MSAAVVRTTDLEAPPEAVWQVLGDFAAIAEWAPNVDHSCAMNATGSGVGAARRVQVGSTALVETVTAWDPPTTLSYRIDGLPAVVRSATNTWHVFGSDGGCRVTLTSIVDAGSRPPQQVAARVVGRVMARGSDQMLAGLRNQLLANETGVTT